MTAIQNMVLLGIACVGITACPPSHEPSVVREGSAAPQIDEHQARTLVIKKYRHLFRGAYLRDSRTGAYHAFPPLDEAQLQFVESRGDAWLVRADPPAGWIVRARVAKNGDWVDLSEVDFASE